jgi:hypothetical protein
VILVSSEHSFPFRLCHPDLAFNTDDFTNYIFAGEISPKSMFELLTGKWGIDPYLANVLIDFYGGHIYDVYRALLRLYSQKENFHTRVTSPGNKVRNCLKWKGNSEKDRENMIEALRQLAITGFYPVEDEKDPIVEIISQNNVGGFVQKSAIIIGLRSNVWDQTEFENGIVPSKQSMRLAIAEVLKN